jgi:putative ABC transport system permease protein
MTRHLLRLVWNRKRTTLLVMIEIAVAFLVLFAVVAFATYALDNWRRPVGFAWDRVWDVEIDAKAGPSRTSETESAQRTAPAPAAQPSGDAGGATAQAQPPPASSGTPPGEAPPDPRFQTLQQLLLALRDVPEVEVSAVAALSPFELGGMVHAQSVGERALEFGANEVSDTYAEVLGLRLSRGRWLSREDAGQPSDPVVVNEELAREVFGDADPIGRSIVEPDAQDLARGERPTRVVGVVAAYREDGEFDAQRNFAFYRKDVEHPSGRRDRVPRHVLVRVRPGTTADFEERLVRRLQALAPAWSFEVRTLSAMRDTQLRFTLLPLAAIGTVAASLLLMVALGLLGVLWQAVTQRTREIGLRRAKGATTGAIGRQVLAEITIMTTLALVPAVVVAVQVPLLGPFYWVEWHVYAVALAISLAAIYVLAGLCGWYPARLASAVQPADALRYE